MVVSRIKGKAPMKCLPFLFCRKEVNMRPKQRPYTPSAFELVDDISFYSDAGVYLRIKKYRNILTGEIKSVPVYAL